MDEMIEVKEIERRSRGLSCGCLVMILVLVASAGILTPALQQLRESARRLTCQGNVKDIVLATNLYESKYKRLPPSCHVKEFTAEDGVTRYRKDGYSFFVELLPMLGQEEIYATLNPAALLDEDGEATDAAMAESLPQFRCPSTKTQSVVNGQAITNYKAVSASTRRAYEVSSREDAPDEGLDIYGTGVLYNESDGVMYPGSRTRLMDISDGTSNTFVIVESEEPIFSRWLVGQECGLYTMPENVVFSAPTDLITYIHPRGYTANIYGVDSTIPASNRGTNLDRDYVKSPYPWGEDGFRSARYSKEPAQGTRFGPGSGHGGVVMHGYVSGAVDSLPINVDTAAYFFLTTRNGGDPGMTMGCDEYPETPPHPDAPADAMEPEPTPTLLSN